MDLVLAHVARQHPLTHPLLVWFSLSSRTPGPTPGCDTEPRKPRNFGDVMLTGKLLSFNVYFQIGNEK
jgi:hypothetical protein